jgi:hypothetical protein
MGNLHCTFLFSDPAEWELFVAKIISEKNLVQHWFVVNGAFNFKGEFIGLCAKKLLESESRLELYKSRITIIESEENHFYNIKRRHQLTPTDIFRYLRNRKQQSVARREKLFFFVERRARDLATSAILSQTAESDWLLITDVDEILDATGVRGDYIRDKLANTRGKFLRVPRLRYVFDFDNLDPQMKFCPIIQVSLLAGEDPLNISDFRFRQDGSILTARPIVYEYSYCFPMEAIRRKLQNFAHVGPDQEMFSTALRLNHHFIHPGMSTSARVWLEQSKPEIEFHATYVVENFANLQTGNINPDYESARKNEFPKLFS